MNDHESTRAAFEANFGHQRVYSDGIKRMDSLQNMQWAAWCAALDWRDSQVCEWRPAVLWPFYKPGCGAEKQKERSLTQYPFCPACGRRVKIQTTNQTNP